MATLTLKRKPRPDAPDDRRREPARAPVRGHRSGLARRPTLAEAQAERARRDAETPAWARGPAAAGAADRPGPRAAGRDRGREGDRGRGRDPGRPGDARRDGGPRREPPGPFGGDRRGDRAAPRRDAMPARREGPPPHGRPTREPRPDGPRDSRVRRQDGGWPRDDGGWPRHDDGRPHPAADRPRRDAPSPHDAPAPRRAAPAGPPAGRNTAFDRRPGPAGAPLAAPRRHPADPRPDRPPFASGAAAAAGRAAAPGAGTGARDPRDAGPGPTPSPRQPRPLAPPAGDLLRLSKYMGELGLASRREADEWIAKGWVRVDGEVVDTLGARVRRGQAVQIDTPAQRAQADKVTVLLNKPVGWVSGQAEDGHLPAVTLVTPANRWSGDRSPRRFNPQQLRSLVPAGRLDIDSVGLLVLTQDGRIARTLIGEDSPVEKEYLVRVQPIDGGGWDESAGLAALRHGLSLDGVALRPAEVERLNEDQLRFVLREGRKRQIRRMCEAVGLAVVGLKRVRIGGVRLGELPPGQWRYLGADESFVPASPRASRRP
ncbi:pseudouridine synthase [Piscinibacter sakaiensis]|uniref:pseudouridine synthase n=1 Tax=Piscinibacter sakaiensis TaxID=1547922 RepID=UPI0006B647C4|nr:pseudouridine synthase [Piscinibacter sakaiensis]